MFLRRKRLVEIASLDVPNIELLQNWVHVLIQKLDLKEGEFTILPAYGGVLIYLKNQGITWIPYSEIKIIENIIDKGKLAESSAIIGGIAVISATGGISLPFILLPSVVAKIWYKTVARPSPKKRMTFLQSLISEVVVEQTKINTALLDKFEDIPLQRKKGIAETSTYTLHINTKYFTKKVDSNPIRKFFKYFMSVFTGVEIPVFPIHPESDVHLFAKHLDENGIKVKVLDSDKQKELPKDGIIID